MEGVGEDHYGEERWNPVNFPNGPSGVFKKRMEAFGIKLGGIMKPRIHLATEQGRYATAHDFWVKGRAPYNDYFSGKLTNDLDFSIPECRQLFWEHAIPAFDSGIVGWWNDEADAWGSTWEACTWRRRCMKASDPTPKTRCGFGPTTGIFSAVLNATPTQPGPETSNPASGHAATTGAAALFGQCRTSPMGDGYGRL